MFDLVPLARPRREMANVDSDAEFVGRMLELLLPYTRAIAVAPARVAVMKSSRAFWVALRADLPPPCLDGCDRECRRIVIDAYADQAIVSGKVVNAIRNCRADGIARKIMDVHQFRVALRLPLSPTILEVADEFLLLRVAGDTGTPGLMQPRAFGLIYSTCALRSGCWAPSTDFLAA